MTLTNPICFALDFPNLPKAINFLDRHDLYPHIGAVKVGLELFMAEGPEAVQAMTRRGLTVVLDLKLHDIPETVARAVTAAGNIGVKYLTIHIQQKAALEAALKAAEPFGITLLGVTVLTSTTDNDFGDLQWDQPPNSTNTPNLNVTHRTLALTHFGIHCGLKGLVCSPQVVSSIRFNVEKKKTPFLLVPGIRPAGSAAHDQKQVGTPGQAIRDGADLLVIGRPIRDAENPREAAKSILAEIQQAREPAP